MKVAQEGQIKGNPSHTYKHKLPPVYLFHPGRQPTDPYSCSSPSFFILPLIFIPPLTPPKPKQPAHTPDPRRRRASDHAPALGGATDHGIARLGGGGPGALGDVAAPVVAALALGPVGALGRRHVADGLGQAALPELAGREVVDAVLERVDLLVAGYLGPVEVFWDGEGGVRRSVYWWMGKGAKGC